MLLALLLVPTLTFGADLQRLQTTPRITTVTVYPDRAMTTRTASLSLKPGSYLVAFDNLPPLVQDDSVRVEGKGSAGVTIAGLEVKRVFLEQSSEKRVREIDEEIRGLERQSGVLDARKAGLASQKSFLDSIRVAWGERISRELATGRPIAAELQEAAGFVGSGVTKAEEQNLAIDGEKQLLRDRIDALKRQRDESAGSRRKESKTVEVSLEVAREGNFSLDLSAVTGQAGWEPSYDVRLAADGKTAGLTFRAMVRQQTGEEWRDVELSLSTARPAAGGAPPELNPWHISFYRPPPPMPIRAAPAPYEAKVMGRMMKAEQPERMLEQADGTPAEYLTAQMSGEQTSFSFRIPRPVDIPSDGTQHGSVVALEQLPVSLEFLAVPKLSPSVFLKSEIINRAGYPLLAGRVNIFTGNTYTGSSYLKKVAAGEKFDLFFGSDDQVTVKREELKQYKEAGLFGRNRMEYRYRIEVGNFRGEARTVTVRDQLPIAGDSEIKVSLEEPSLKPEEIRDDGRLTWKLPLKAGEKRELTFGISVEYPKDREISGL
ncbi:MAG: mucoidy inhibitor MuiA family protein [Desulfuromonadales bacterium]|nr:mucoidy inhibitor MuiA family protein [Desulfuromonadales bacterium]